MALLRQCGRATARGCWRDRSPQCLSGLATWLARQDGSRPSPWHEWLLPVALPAAAGRLTGMSLAAACRGVVATRCSSNLAKKHTEAQMFKEQSLLR